jgi:hypothetical protein
MLDTMKARGGDGDTRALEEVLVSRPNSFNIAISNAVSQRLIGYRVDPCLRVQPLFREVANG